LKAEVRGDTSDCKMVSRESENLQREINSLRDEIRRNQSAYEHYQGAISETKGKIQDYESRLRYGNDVIMGLEAENQQIQIDNGQLKAVIET
jgi:chromosome segregation ATPase